MTSNGFLLISNRTSTQIKNRPAAHPLPLKNELTNEKKMEWFTCIVNAALRPCLQYFSSDLFRVSPSRDAAAFSVEFNPE